MSGPGWRDCALLAGLLALWSSVALSDQGGTPPPPPALGSDGGPPCFLRQVQRRSTLLLHSAALHADGVLKAGKGSDAGGARLTASGPRRAQ